jgi:NADPH:quinone reductase-like Zn-dependent oxidoreductase
MQRPDPARFDLVPGARTMWAVVTTGNGGYDRLSYRRVPVPVPGTGEVLIRVLAAGVNNNEINTRIGWYSESVTSATDAAAQDEESIARHKADGGWNRPTPFPFIQGTDCCGRAVEAGPNAEAGLIGRRVLVRPCMRLDGFASLQHVWMGSDVDGAFAQYVKVPASEVFPVDCTWSDAELATIPCAYGTAENMLHRSGVGPGEVVLVAGASGGVGSAAVQLARRRGARVIAVAGRSKAADVRAIGAERVLDRDDDPEAALGRESVDVVVDSVAGPGFPSRLKVLRRGGRFVSCGAIAGPTVSLDMRDVYLKDLALIGCTAWDGPVFPNLIGYIERGEIRPLLARTYPLSGIAEAQRDFLEKQHVGKLVLIAPGGDQA